MIIGGVAADEIGGALTALCSVAGTKIVVSSLQCGHSTVRVSPLAKPLASNSMCPLQYLQKHFANRGAETLITFRVLASVEDVKTGKRQKLR